MNTNNTEKHIRQMFRDITWKWYVHGAITVGMQPFNDLYAMTNDINRDIGRTRFNMLGKIEDDYV